MKYIKSISIFIAILSMSSCEKMEGYDTGEELNTLLTSKEWQVAYIMEEHEKGPVRYNDNYLTTDLIFTEQGEVFTEIDNIQYAGKWQLIPIKSNNYYIDIDIQGLEYISRGWVLHDIYGWGYEQTRVIVRTYDFDKGINYEMGLY